ncbi:MAG: hypothetical protein A2622_00545 [Bdellovibrionales bacterium RIFCSPHIGHO2_01_FULL_40_29]|nr:MAG: hypothetical protein A2622_00545 [Bdellovibrionales bacterium RIFCSPHIGHO2_01_FULL_40_29]OFZ32611.1 MAG: hypothetical protein A3D17_05145 [Bdellovibrionales bacterium RIFCSPHIGHO2_02_FULL_40_15]
MNASVELKEILHRTLKELTSTVNDWLKHSNIPGREFFRPINQGSSWQFGTGSPELIPQWYDAIEPIFGAKLEKLKIRDELAVKLSPYYNSQSPPPRWSFGDDITHEIKILIFDFLRVSKFRDRTIFIDNENGLILDAVDFFTRSADEYFSKIPLLGITLPSETVCENSMLTPLTWDMRVDLFRDNSTGIGGTRDQMYAQRVLEAHTLLTVSVKRPRKAGSAFLMGPDLQIVSTNFIHLLRIYDYGPIFPLWDEHFIKAIGLRSCGRIQSGSLPNSVSPSNYYSVKDIDNLQKFLNKFMKIDRIDEGPMSFVFSRLTDAWLKGRTENFKIFDYVSILEGLLVTSNEGEFRFRVSVLTAAFIAENTEEKRKIFGLVKRAYDIRSKVAHCAKDFPQKELLTLDELKYLGKITHFVIQYAMEHGLEKLKKDALDRLLC